MSSADQYTYVVKQDDDGTFCAICLESPSHSAFGDTMEEALRLVMEDVEYDSDMPDPLGFQEALESVGL